MVNVNSRAYTVFWNYVRNREVVMAARILNRNVHTSDPVLAKYRFTSPWRWADRVSQDYIRRLYEWNAQNVSYGDVVLRTMLYRIFNKPSTFDLLCNVTPICVSTFCDHAAEYIEALGNWDDTLYSHAYTYRTYGKYSHGMTRFEAYIRQTADLVAADRINSIVENASSLHKSFNALKACYGWGDFMCLQVVTDLGYSTYTSWEENDWITASRGSIRGLTKIFPDITKSQYQNAIAFLHGQQNHERVIPFCGMPLSLSWMCRTAFVKPINT